MHTNNTKTCWACCIYYYEKQTQFHLISVDFSPETQELTYYLSSYFAEEAFSKICNIIALVYTRDKTDHQLHTSGDQGFWFYWLNNPMKTL